MPPSTLNDLKHLFGVFLEKALLDLTNQEPPNTPVSQDQSPAAPDMIRLKQLLVKLTSDECASVGPFVTTNLAQSIETGSRNIDQPVWHSFALNRSTYLLDLTCIVLKSSPCPMTTIGTKPNPPNFKSILPHPIIRIPRIQRKQWLRFCLSVLTSIQRSPDTAVESPWSQ